MMRNLTTLSRKIINANLSATPLRPLFVGISLALLLAGAIRAQDYSLQTGTPTFNTALPVEMGFLDVANGNLHLERPLGSFSQRGSRQFVARLVYDSRIWQVVGSGWHPSNVPGQGGWRFLTNVDTGGVSYSSTTVSCLIGGFLGGHWYPSYTIRSNFSWTDPNGTTHVFPAVTEQPVSGTPCSSPLNQPTGGGYANDSTGLYLSVTNYSTVTIYGPDGSQVYPTVEDTNGNYFSTDGSGNVKDTLGRVPITKTSNCNGNSSQTCYDVLNSQGSTSRFTITTTNVSVSTAFGQSGVTEFSGSLTVVQKIALPDGTFYQFGYDSYGELNSITLPTLGQVTFGYTNYQDSFGNKNRWATSRVSGGGTWSYTPAVISTCGSGQVGCQQQVTVTKPSGDNAVYMFTLDNGAWVGSVQSYTGTVSPGNLLSTLSLTWNMSNSCSPTPCSGNNYIQTTAETLTLPVPGGSSISKTTKLVYDSSNDMNLKSIQEWKFYSGSLPVNPDRQTDITYKTNYGHIINRSSQSTTCVPTGTPPTCTGSTNILAQTNFSYDDAGTLSNTSPATGIQNHDDAAYGISNTTRGNITSIKRCTNFSSCGTSNVQTLLAYDTTGQTVSAQDPNGNITNLGYGDRFYKDIGDGPANPPQTYSVSTPTNAYLTSVAPPLIPASTLGYFYGTGQLALITDANNQTTYSHFFDSFNRPTSAVLPNGGWTYNAYNSSETQVDSYTGITGTFATSGCTGCRQDEVLLDNLGRLTSQRLMSDPEGIDYVVPTYDTSGRILKATHPYRSTSDPTYGLETPTYDGLNRTIKATHQDGTYSQTLFGAAVVGTGVNATQLCSSSTYGLGYPTLVVDEAGKKRETWADGFGRTIEGDEPDSNGNLTSNTCYSYDLLGNLLQVVHGSQTRTIAYDALSRVTSITIPERANSSGANCAVTYTYDSNSNLQTRTTPAPNQNASCTNTVTTTYSYDALNRLTKISYGATTPVSTPTVQYAYDGNSLSGCTIAPPSLTDSNPKGRMTSMCDGSGATSWAHDSMGGILTEKRAISGVTQTVSYTYNLDGSPATVTYPSSKTVTYTVSNAQRLTAANDAANGVQFATAASYAAPGMLNGMITGQINGGFGGITESHTYNTSLEYTSSQATSTVGTALNLSLSFNLTGGDNGTVTTITNNVDNGRTQTLTYDPLNRISSAITQATSGGDCWGQNFAPDALANLNTISSAQCNSNTLSVTVDTNNHINVSSFAYDAAGNTLQDGKGTGYSYSFDAENRLVQATGMTGGPWCYVYDGLGLRVAKKSGANSDCSAGTVTKLYWRSPSGDTLAETDGSGNPLNEYVFLAGRRVASRDGSGHIFYWFTDQLGSTRTITTGNGPGQTPGQLCYDADFTPYGQELSYSARLQTTACPPNYKFTGYERDPETAYGQGDTGVDYALARYYSSRLGRFLSTDPLGGSVGSLQSHNAYAYVINNPMNLTDPSGMDFCNGGNSPYTGGGGTTNVLNPCMPDEMDAGYAAYNAWMDALFLYPNGVSNGVQTFSIGWSIDGGAYWQGTGPNGETFDDVSEFDLPTLPSPSSPNGALGFSFGAPAVPAGRGGIGLGLKDIFKKYPACAKLLGGLEQADKIADMATQIAIDAPGFVPPKDDEGAAIVAALTPDKFGTVLASAGVQFGGTPNWNGQSIKVFTNGDFASFSLQQRQGAMIHELIHVALGHTDASKAMDDMASTMNKMIVANCHVAWWPNAGGAR